MIKNCIFKGYNGIVIFCGVAKLVTPSSTPLATLALKSIIDDMQTLFSIYLLAIKTGLLSHPLYKPRRRTFRSSSARLEKIHARNVVSPVSIILKDI